MKTASPGFLIEIHSTLVRKDALLDDLHELLTATLMPKHPIATDWQKTNEPSWEEPTAPVQYFTLGTGSKKIGNDPDQVETLIINMECAQKDALYMKLLLVETNANQDAYGIFVPKGHHLTQGIESYKQLLRGHNEYLTSVGVVAVEGINEAAMTHDIELKGKKITLMSSILTSSIGVDSVEETNHTNESEKWFLLEQKSLVTRVHNFVGMALIRLFNEHIPAELQHPTIITPCRACASAKAFLGLYANVLKKKMEPTNPQEDNQIKP
eukprot:8716743-Ditylum_brightwellii.AAC.1